MSEITTPDINVRAGNFPNGPIGANAEHHLVKDEDDDYQIDPDKDAPWWDPFGLKRRIWAGFEAAPEKDQILAKYEKGCCTMLRARVDYFFALTARKSSFTQELFGGLTTFFSMAYILILNPIIVAGGIGQQWKEGVFFATALASGIFTIAMGVLVNAPIALAPGMGLNSYFANVARVSSTGVLIGVMDFQQAMGAIFMSGVIYIVLTYTGIRFLLFSAVPEGLRHAMSTGIGLFICVVGYRIGKITEVYAFLEVPTPGSIPYYAYDLRQMNLLDSAETRITVVGLVFLAIFMTLRFRAGILIAIVFTTLCGISGGGRPEDGSVTDLSVWREDPIPFIAKVDNLLFGKLNFDLIGTGRFWEVTWTFMFVDLFDSFGTASAITARSGIGGSNKNLANRMIRNAMNVDGWGTLFGATLGSNSITMYIESLSGIAAGARTGLTAVTVGTLFLLSLLFMFPFVAMIPNSATMPALFMVGAFSMESVKYIDMDDMPMCISAFMMIATMPFTYSIANGIAAGFIFYNLCLIVRWLDFRRKMLLERGWASFSLPKEYGCPKWMVWSEEWNMENKKDFLPHPGMALMGIFMVLRYLFFFH